MLYKTAEQIVVSGKLKEKRGTHLIVTDAWNDPMEIEASALPERLIEKIRPMDPLVLFCHLDEDFETLIAEKVICWDGIHYNHSNDVVVILGKVCDNKSFKYQVVQKLDGSQEKQLAFSVYYREDRLGKFLDCVLLGQKADEFHSQVYPRTIVAIVGRIRKRKNGGNEVLVTNLESVASTEKLSAA